MSSHTAYPLLAAMALLATLGTAKAQTAQEHEAHHSGSGAPPAAAVAAQPQESAGDMDMSKMKAGNMMGDMASMMQRMHGGMMPGTAGMRALQHIEGEIAYYKAELHITEAQAQPWNAFADALRGNALHLRQAMTSAGMSSGLPPAPQQMEQRATLLTAQLEALKSLQAAAEPLYAVLSEAQKKAADQLAAEHFMSMRAGGL